MTPTHIQRLRVVIPVFNDWESCTVLMQKLDVVAAGLPCQVFASVVDDGSTLGADAFLAAVAGLANLQGLEIVRLSTNVGHQRAIAIGLCRASDAADCDAVLVMDSDGEDPPAAMPELLAACGDRKDFCIVAQRRRRSENLTFRASYVVYRSMFQLVTGKKIRFGNFSLLSASFVARLVMLPDLWNNLAAAILRSRFPIDQVPVDRGTRYAGRSKMNFTSLIVHGFSAISVYADTIFVRLLLATLVMVGLTFLVSTTVLALRIFVPAHATPGWATTVTFSMVIIVLQALFTTLTALLSILNTRVQRLTLPILDFRPYIRTVEPVLPARRNALA